MARIGLPIVLTFAIASTAAAQSASPVLLRGPSVSQTQIAFSCGGDIWTVSREGGDGEETHRRDRDRDRSAFSPDGTQIAFTGEYDGNVDVYVVPAAGGVPRRLTCHPGADAAVGWTPDGKRVLFSSSRRRAIRTASRLFTVPAEGGFPTEVPLPIGRSRRRISPDGRSLAYVPDPQWQPAWKRYRGGRPRRIWIADARRFAASSQRSARRIPTTSIPCGSATRLFPLRPQRAQSRCSPTTSRQSRCAKDRQERRTRLQVRVAGPGAIVYEQFGSLHLYDLEFRAPSAS